MTEFIVFAIAMVAVCLAVILIPMWMGADSRPDRRREANIEIYHQRHAEIERDVDANRLTAADGEAETQALGARLLADVYAEPATDPATRETVSRARPWLASALSVILVAAGGVGAYVWLGDPQAIRDQDMPNVGQLMSRLKADVAAHPNDRDAILMLAQAQQSRGRYAAAAGNLRKVNQQSSRPDVRLLSAEAQMRVAAGEDLSGRTSELFERVLKRDPGNVKALWYLGLRAAQNDHNRDAIDYWNRLLKQQVPPQIRSMVTSRRNALSGDVPGL